MAYWRIINSSFSRRIVMAIGYFGYPSAPQGRYQPNTWATIKPGVTDTAFFLTPEQKKRISESVTGIAEAYSGRVISNIQSRDNRRSKRNIPNQTQPSIADTVAATTQNRQQLITIGAIGIFLAIIFFGRRGV
jgi:hypothetical protein